MTTTRHFLGTTYTVRFWDRPDIDGKPIDITVSVDADSPAARTPTLDVHDMAISEFRRSGRWAQTPGVGYTEIIASLRRFA